MATPVRVTVWGVLLLAFCLALVGCQWGGKETGPRPTPTLGPEVAAFPCGPSGGPSSMRGPGFEDAFIQWTPDGKHIVFGGYGALNVADAGGTHVRTVVAVSRPETPHQAPTYGFHADVSSDGSRIVYSTCQYETESLPEPLYDYYDRAEKYHYEIATIGIDGSSPKRLTENESFDHYPVWSPDGARIAYVGTDDRYNPERSGRAQLRTMSADGSDVSVLTALPSGVTLRPPAWSPDGQWLVFLVNEEGLNPYITKALYTIRADETGLSNIGETSWLPAWSPDGRRLAFAAGLDSESIVYTVDPDGGGLVEVLRGMGGPVAWSPDGSEVLVSYMADRELATRPRGEAPLPGGIYAARADGGGVRRQSPYLFSTLSTWSPDGSRVAFYSQDGEVVTTAPDGTDLQGVVAPSPDRGLVALNPPRPAASAGVEACTGESVVPDPEANPGLVEDCRVLLGLRDELAGSAELNWNEATPIGQWEGVSVEGSPLRVHSVTPYDVGLTGRLPPELGKLTALRWLGFHDNLTGPIPPELGSLEHLEILEISGTYLTAPYHPNWGS